MGGGDDGWAGGASRRHAPGDSRLTASDARPRPCGQRSSSAISAGPAGVEGVGVCQRPGVAKCFGRAASVAVQNSHRQKDIAVQRATFQGLFQDGAGRRGVAGRLEGYRVDVGVAGARGFQFGGALQQGHRLVGATVANQEQCQRMARIRRTGGKLNRRPQQQLAVRVAAGAEVEVRQVDVRRHEGGVEGDRRFEGLFRFCRCAQGQGQPRQVELRFRAFGAGELCFAVFRDRTPALSSERAFRVGDRVGTRIGPPRGLPGDGSRPERGHRHRLDGGKPHGTHRIFQKRNGDGREFRPGRQPDAPQRPHPHDRVGITNASPHGRGALWTPVGPEERQGRRPGDRRRLGVVQHSV